MAAAPHASNSAEPATAQYVCTTAIIDGLPPRNLLKTEARYSLRYALSNNLLFDSREVRTRASKVEWDAPEDRRLLDCCLTDVLRVSLQRGRRSGSAEELGWREFSVIEWLEQGSTGVTLTTASTSKKTPKGPIRLRLILLPRSDGPQPPESSSRAVVRRDPTAPPPPSPLVPTTSASTQRPPITPPPAVPTPAGVDVKREWEPLLENVDKLIQRLEAPEGGQGGLESGGEASLQGRMVQMLLKTALNVVSDQAEAQNAKIMELVRKMRTVYGFLCEATELRSDREREETLALLARQTVDCANFLTKYAAEPDVFHKALVRMGSSAQDKLDQYIASFDRLLVDFQTRSSLHTELVTVRMLADFKGFSSKMDIQQIPYVIEAGLERDKRCLPGTRTKMLHEMAAWAADASSSTPRTFLLTGTAGTGKSTIAHTIASLFDSVGQLGSMFCFKSSEGTTRKPASLFRNMARDLCKGRPEFKTALCKSIGDDLATCTTGDLNLQFERFILEPARMLQVSGTVVIVVDGLDESGTTEERAKLLKLLRKRIKELPPCFRFFVTAREEADIAAAFPTSTVDVIVQRMPTLQDDPTLQRDMLTFITFSLTDDITEELLAGLPAESCQTLALRSQGVFQWAAVACSHIRKRRPGEKYSKRYELFLQRREDVGLDGLYKRVLTDVLDPEAKKSDHEAKEQVNETLDTFRTVMGIIVTMVEPPSMRSLRTFMGFVRPEDSVDTYEFLRSLGSLISGVAEDGQPVRPLHSSFSELVTSSKRGGMFYIGATGHHERIVAASLRMLTLSLIPDWQKSSKLISPELLAVGKFSNGTLPPHLHYASKYWRHHLAKCSAFIEDEDSEQCCEQQLSVMSSERDASKTILVKPPPYTATMIDRIRRLPAPPQHSAQSLATAPNAFATPRLALVS